MLNFYYLLSFVQNVVAIKTFTIGPITDSYALFLTIFVFAFMDITTELKGEDEAKRIFKKALIYNTALSIVCGVIALLPSNSNTVQSAFSTIFGTNIRFIVASGVGFYFGNWVNNRIMARAEGGFCFRGILSTLFGQFVDNAGFILLAFTPIFNLPYELPWKVCLTMVGTKTILETVLESCIVPFSRLYVEKHRN